jgi:hypothetical protein
MHLANQDREAVRLAQRYYFDLVEDGQTLSFDEGVELLSAADIELEAERCAAWIAAGYCRRQRPAIAYIRVRDSAGFVCLELPITDSQDTVHSLN